MKQIKNILTIASAALLVSSCSDWTTPESIKIVNPSLETENPELYQAYLESLKEYRSSDHQVMIAKFNNDAEVPAGRADHINCLPDSVDFVILEKADSLSECIASEISEIREKKAVSTLYSIDFAVIESEWNAILEAEKEEAEEGTEEGVEEQAEEDGSVSDVERFVEYIGQRMDYYLSLYGKYGYDGINIVYNGVSPLSMPQDKKEEVKMYQNAFFGKVAEWKSANGNAVLFFEGKAQNVMVHQTLVAEARYIILSAVSASSFDEYALTLESAKTDGIPTDRYILCVTTPSLDDPTKTDGIFPGVENESAIIAAGTWAASTSASYNVQGVCVEQAQNDYFNTTKIYRNIRGAISIMNPSPIK